MFRNPNRCPSCGERVSQFAAGCAICGTALDPRRGQRRSLADRLRSAWRSRPGVRARVPVRRRPR